MIYEALKDIMKSRIHALQIKASTYKESNLI